ncbi:phosphatase PAP2 family protein [Halosolutus amylolyticus]|uniref:Phosphatase PAP2 family protein n=1 Tax=Halosolutus amylolyticus TaxID=2932267 RepID=A0ABD5PKR2_9EURY|nr:phosphatase PAP2 family protein [Halosolutus amylolyticus]
MSRGIGEFGPIQEFVPEWAAVVVALVTQLGDVWFLSLIVGALYWVSAREDRERAAVFVGLPLIGLSVVTGLKYVFALPRPDRPLAQLETVPVLAQPLYEATAYASGYGFPSGHAMMTTVVYGYLALALSVGTARQRVAGAAALVAAVCLSRVALGVHYLVDVLAGVLVGLAVLLVTTRLLARYRTEAGTVVFALAIGASAFAVVSSGGDPDAVLLLGASLGAFGAWQLLRLASALSAADRPADDRRSLVARGVLAVAAFVPLLAAPVFVLPPSVPALGGAIGLAVAVGVAVPVARHSDPVTEGLRTLPGACWRRVAVAFRR